ncbi:MAG: TRCF domain-containing protein, partial [Thermodesulfobacteriota bacterium]
YDQLGGGFKLAMSDLQIRGGGNLLGVSQSGHIAAVGYELYLDLLGRTVADLKRKAAAGAPLDEEELEPEINLKLSAFIPESYIRDAGQRYLAYRRIAGLGGEEELAELAAELRDRYGELPPELCCLLAIVGLKGELKALRIAKLEAGDRQLVLSFLPDSPVDPKRILALTAAAPKARRFTPDARLLVETDAAGDALLEEAKKILQALK